MAACDQVMNAGVAHIEMFREDGSYEEQTVPNLVVNSGLAWIAARTTGSPAVMSHMALGGSTYAVAANQTGLGQERGRSTLASATTSAEVTTYVANFGPGVATGTVTEIAIFNAASGGTMLNRAVFTSQQKGSGDSIRVTWNVTQSA